MTVSGGVIGRRARSTFRLGAAAMIVAGAVLGLISLTGCLVSALTAGLAKGGVSSTGRALASALAGLLIVDAVARVALPAFAAGQGGLPPGTTVAIGAGFWMALAGFVLSRPVAGPDREPNAA